MILVKAQQMKENLCSGRKKKKKRVQQRCEYTRHTFISQIEYKCSVYIISSSYRIIDIVCVCLHQCTCYDYKTVNSSTDSTV